MSGSNPYYAIERGEEPVGMSVLHSDDGEDYALTGDGISYPTMTGGAEDGSGGVAAREVAGLLIVAVASRVGGRVDQMNLTDMQATEGTFLLFVGALLSVVQFPETALLWQRESSSFASALSSCGSR